MNPPQEAYCLKCSLDLDPRVYQKHTTDSFPSTRTLVIILVIVVALGLLLWLIAAVGTSGLSDT